MRAIRSLRGNEFFVSVVFANAAFRSVAGIVGGLEDKQRSSFRH